MRLIDADALAKFIDYGHLHNPNEKAYSENDIREMIDMMPTADAVPVIRCKDCKYYNPQQHYCEGIGNWFGYDGEWSDNGYCYKAERKEE